MQNHFLPSQVFPGKAPPPEPSGGGAFVKVFPRTRREAEPSYFLKLSFRLTLRLKTRWPGALSRLSRQK